MNHLDVPWCTYGPCQPPQLEDSHHAGKNLNLQPPWDVALLNGAPSPPTAPSQAKRFMAITTSFEVEESLRNMAPWNILKVTNLLGGTWSQFSGVSYLERSYSQQKNGDLDQDMTWNPWTIHHPRPCQPKDDGSWVNPLKASLDDYMVPCVPREIRHLNVKGLDGC